MPSRHLPAALLAAALALGPAAARAAESSTEARLREALRAATAQVHALQDEKGKLQAREGQLQAELEALKKQGQRPARCVDTKSGELARQLAEFAAAKAQLEGSLVECQDKARAAESQGAETVKQATDEVAGIKGRLAECQAMNARMYQVAHEVLQKFSRKPGGENILGFARVARENAAQDYEDKLSDQKVRQP
jgi:chromosome segregation ATPase